MLENAELCLPIYQAIAGRLLSFVTHRVFDASRMFAERLQWVVAV